MVSTWEIAAVLIALGSGAISYLAVVLWNSNSLVTWAFCGGILAAVLYRVGKQKQLYRNASPARPVTSVNQIGLIIEPLLVAGIFYMVGSAIARWGWWNLFL